MASPVNVRTRLGNPRHATVIVASGMLNCLQAALQLEGPETEAWTMRKKKSPLAMTNRDLWWFNGI